jgi:hypothetical protein
MDYFCTRTEITFVLRLKLLFPFTTASGNQEVKINGSKHTHTHTCVQNTFLIKLVFQMCNC